MFKNLLPLLFLFISTTIFSQSFTSIWNTNNTSPQSPSNTTVTIPTNPAYTNYNYSVDWGDGDVDNNVAGDITHTYAASGIYTISISGTFPAIFFNNIDTSDKLKIIEITDWGTIQWQTMENAFHGCENLNFDAIAAPDLSEVTTLKDMFRECTSFNGIMNNWDLSTITNISGIFYEAEIFNRPLDNWNTANITDMSYAFYRARQFNEPLDNWNTGAVTTMEYLFSEASRFNQNINNWNVTQVENMSGTFRYAGNYNRPLNNWVVDNVTNMSFMFAGSNFDFPIENWNVSNVTDMSGMFYQARQFNQPVQGWDVSNVTNMERMFELNEDFNQPVEGWNISNVTNMSRMFKESELFNQPLNNWNVSSVVNMSGMFQETESFNQPLDNWVVDNVTNMEHMFDEAILFNQDLSSWNVDLVTNMSSMFQRAEAFNQNISVWNVGNVTDMSSMFFLATVFNQPLDSWNVSQVTNMSGMFRQSPVFDQPLNNWNTSAVTNISSMFQGASNFNQNLAIWDISNVSNMNSMLSNSGISQENYDNVLIGWASQTVRDNVNLGASNLNYCDGLDARQQLIDNSNWNITGDIVNCSYVLCADIISPFDGDQNVPANSEIRWNATPNAAGYIISIRREDDSGNILQVVFDEEDVGNVTGVNFTNEFFPNDNVFVTVLPYNSDNETAPGGCSEISFKTVPSWVNSPDAFKITIDTRNLNSQSTNANQYRLDLNDGFPDYLDYNFSVDWGDNRYDNNVTNDITHTYLTPGIYTIAIIGDFPSYYQSSSNRDNLKLISMDQWGTQIWGSMKNCFYFCENMEYNATDIPNLSQVTNMQSMFRRTSLFNGNINNWDVSNVTNMSNIFYQAYIFNQPLNNWNVSNVTNMASMFNSATNFNQNLDNWDTSSVTTFVEMFQQAEVFNQNINGWNVSSATDMSGMFQRAEAFNQPLNSWNVSNVTNMRKMFNGFVSDMIFNQPLDNWNVSNVTDMSEMFRRNINFNQPLNSWNVNNVTNMSAMFQDTKSFNQPLDNWNVSLVTNMQSMFSGAEVFNQNIDVWNVTNVTTMSSMFSGALAFDQPLSNWDVNSVVNMSSMFRRAQAFNQPLDNWDVSAVANMSYMFNYATLFDQPLNSWDVTSVTLMSSMFEGAAAFNNPIGNWNVASVTNMQEMFKDAVLFNQPIENWNTGEVLTMQEMFYGATAFNQNIDSWNTSFVTNMEEMFREANSFNQSLNSWNVASVTTMQGMFREANSFDGSISSWNVRGVTTMQNMFDGATVFNQNLNNWRISGVTNMDYMFRNAFAYDQAMDLWNLGNVSMRSTFDNATALNQYLGDWDISGVTEMEDMLDLTALTRENYDNTLIAWSEQNVTSDITLGAEGLPYCDAQEERQSMIDTFGWTFDQDVRDCPIPECTQLASPLNGATDVPVNTNISWDAVLFAQGYRLTVGTTAGGNDIVNNETITNETSYEFAADFNTGDIIYVTLIPFNDEGDAVGPCTEESFTISNDPATIPECTTLTAPLHGANDVLVTSDLSWNPITNADGYRLTVGTSSGGTDILNLEDIGNNTTYEFATNLPEDSDIFVTIIPYNDEGNAASCTEESFNTELIPVPPVCTSLLNPANNATDVPIDTNLSWNAVANATGYLVTVGTTSGGIEVVNNIDVNNATTYDIPSDLQEDRLYFVTIIPYNDEGDATGCIEETFRTGNSTSPPSCVILSAPSNNATGVAPDTNLSWNGSGSADGYRLSVGTTSGGTEIYSGDLGDITTYDPTNDFAFGATIYVTITAYNTNGDAQNCTEESFIIAGPPACTTLITPTNNATNIPVDSSIEWNASPDADGYKLTVTGSMSTANNITNLDVLTATTYDFTNDFDRGETVTVTITPYNNIGDAIGCTSESFTIIPPPVPSCTTLLTPTDGATNIARDSDITWNAAAGATGYRLTVSGSTSTANNLTDFDVSSATTYSFTNDFDQGETVSVTIIPYNAIGDAIGCTAETFTIQPVPVCNSLISPADGAVDVAIDTDMSWSVVPNATGYRLTVVAESSTANNVTNIDITSGNTYTFPNDFEQGETVTVTITPYNASGDAIGCSSEGWTIKPVPTCTNLISPANGATDIAVNSTIEWTPIAEATGYKLTVLGSSSTTNNLTNFEVTTGTSHNFTNDFEQGETVMVTIVPYNEVGDAIGCSSERFTIESVPNCTNLTAPLDGDILVDVNEITWNSVDNTDGYKLTIISNNTAVNNITDLELTATSYVFPNDFNQGEIVTVTITPFNHVGDAIGCTSESFTIRPLPSCTNLISPVNNSTDVSIATDVSWNSSLDTDGYRISVGTTTGGNDIINNEDVASLTSYTFADDLPSETLIYVTITPYNTSGNAVGCITESFTTEVVIPECTELSSPFNGEEDIPLESSISWNEVEKTDGYRISIGTTPSGNEIVDNHNMGNETSYNHPEEFPFGTEIFVTIIPYNSAGDAFDCEQQSFTTLIPEDETQYGFSPDGDGINEYWHIENIQYYPENIVTIYNRWGDAVFKIENYDNAGSVFRGEANLKTKMGAGLLPTGTYFFNIEIEGETILKKTKGYLVIKR